MKNKKKILMENRLKEIYIEMMNKGSRALFSEIKEFYYSQKYFDTKSSQSKSVIK
jgi:hypothetical protein